EAPQNDPRPLAVISKARELVPGKPLTQLVSTHHHFDHSGGVRAAGSEGLSRITHRSTAGFYQDLIGRSHKIAPDALSSRPKPLNLIAVDNELMLQEATMSAVLNPIDCNPSPEPSLIAYF